MAISYHIVLTFSVVLVSSSSLYNCSAMTSSTLVVLGTGRITGRHLASSEEASASPSKRIMCQRQVRPLLRDSVPQPITLLGCAADQRYPHEELDDSQMRQKVQRALRNMATMKLCTLLHPIHPLNYPRVLYTAKPPTKREKLNS
jgi:hypothetical protein